MEQNQSNSTEGIRLNKFLSDAGVCSRRQADHYVEEGRIEIDGRKAVLGERISGNEEIRLDDRLIKMNHKKILLVVNKPKGIVCTTQEKDKDNIVDYLGYPERIYPVGRLDKDSEGLILMTNDGALMDEILRARNYHEKEYEVRVDKPITKEFLEKMSGGVEILDTVTRPCKVEQINRYRFRITLTQGLNRQIRRMCEALEYRVRDLKRIRIMNIRLGSLPLGAYRELSAQEWEELKDLIAKGKEKPEFFEHFDMQGTTGETHVGRAKGFSAQANVRRAKGSEERNYRSREDSSDRRSYNRSDRDSSDRRSYNRSDRDSSDRRSYNRSDRDSSDRRSYNRSDRDSSDRRSYNRNDSDSGNRAGSGRNGEGRANRTSYSRTNDGHADRTGYGRNGEDRANRTSYSRTTDGRADRTSYSRNDSDRGNRAGSGRNDEDRANRTSYSRTNDGRADRTSYNRNGEDRVSSASRTAHGRNSRTTDGSADRTSYGRNNENRGNKTGDHSYRRNDNSGFNRNRRKER